MNKSLIGALLPFATLLLSLAGVVFLVAAAFTLGVTSGFVATGVAFLVLAFYAESEGRP
jgi:hypothetical protein